MANNQITKIYNLQTLGFDAVHKNLQQVSKDFADIAKAKRAAEAGLVNASDNAEVSKYLQQIQQLKVREAELRTQRQQLLNDSKAEQLAGQAKLNQLKEENALRDALIKQKKLDNAQTKADMQSEQLASKQRLQNLAYEAGSIKDIRLQLSELQKLTITRNQASGSTIDFRGQTLSYDQAIEKLKELSAASQAFSRQFQKDGTLVGEYTTGIINAFKQMDLGDLIGGQITKANDRLTSLNTELDALKSILNEVKQNGTQGIQNLQDRLNTAAVEGRQFDAQMQAVDDLLKKLAVDGKASLDAIEKEIIDNRKEFIALRQNVQQIQQDFRGTGDIGTQVINSLNNGFKELKGQVSGLILSYFGVQAAISGIRKEIENSAELSDKYVDLQRVLGATDLEFRKIQDDIKAINTRTSLNQLFDFAFIAAKAGVAQDQIAGVTKALDQLYLVAGKSLGDPEQTFESLVKLNTIFNNGAPATAESLQKIGNALIQLDNAGVASSAFMVDFAKRLAGIEGITKIQIQSVLGLAAAFEENGASAEVAATATSQVLVKLYSDTEKYSAIAGITKKAFEDLLNSNPSEALLRVAQGLKGDAQSATEFAKNFSELEARGVRVQAVMGTLADKTDYFREKISVANAALQDNTAIVDAADKKQQTFAATLDKIYKQFELIGANRTVQIILSSIAGLLALILTNLTPIIITLGLFAAGWALVNKELVLQRLNLLLVNTQLAAGRLALVLITAVQYLFTAGLYATNVALKLVTAAANLFGLSLTGMPLKIVTGLIALLAAGITAMAETTDKASAAVQKHNLMLQLNKDIMAQATKAIADQKVKAESLAKVVKDLSISEDTRMKALKDLINIDPIFQNTLVNGKINIQNLNKALSDYNANLLKNAQLKAADLTQQEQYNKLISLQNVKTSLEIKKAQGGATYQGLSDEELAPFQLGGLGKATINIFGKSNISQGAFKDALANINKDIEQQKKIVEAAQELYKNQFVKDASGPDPKSGITPGPAGRTIADIKADLKKANEDFEKSVIGSKDYNDLRKKIQDLQAELKSADAKDDNKNYRGARLSGTQRDDFKDIDAGRDQALSSAELSHAQGITDEQTYLNQILKINQDAIAKKLALLKGANAEERTQAAKLQLEKINLEKQTNDALFKLRADALTKQYNADKKAAEDAYNQVVDNPASTDIEKSQAKVTRDQALLTAQQKFNTGMDQLEKSLTDESKKNAQARADEIQQINTQLANDSLELQKENLNKQLDEIDLAASKRLLEIQSRIAGQTTAILGDNTKTDSQKAVGINRIEKQGTADLLGSDVKTMQDQLNVYKQMLEKKFITEKEYNEKVTELKTKEAAFAKATADAETNYIGLVINSLKQGVKEILLGIKEFDTQREAINAAIGEALTTVKDAINQAEQAYFQAQQNKIDAERDATLKSLDLEEQKVLKTAQSEAQKAAIQADFDKKRDAAEKKAAEQRRKLALKQLTIDFAVAVVKTLAAYPFPWSLIPVAALGVLYAIQRASVNSQKFAYGGNPDMTTTRGGKVGGRSHADGGNPFIFKGRVFEDEVDELNIIRTKNAPRNQVFQAIGTQQQIASALNKVGGGIDFAPGASIKKHAYGGTLGAVLQAPIFTPASNNVIVQNNSDFSTLSEKFDQLSAAVVANAQAQSNRIDRLEVIQVTSSVTNAQRKEAKQSRIATL